MNSTLPYGTVLYATIRHRINLIYVRYFTSRHEICASRRPLPSQIAFALTGLAARAKHRFYRFRTVFRVPYVIRPWYKSRVRLVSPSDLVLLASARTTCVCVSSFVLYSESFRHRFVIIRFPSSKIHIRDSYEIC